MRRIFTEYLSGDGQIRITKRLNADGIRTRNGNRWNTSCVMTVLKNYTYTGNILLQTTFRENHLTKRKRTNDGQLPQYHVQNSHEAIIDQEEYIRRYDTLAEKYEKLQHRYDTLQKKRDRRLQQADRLSGFLFAVKELDTLDLTFTPALWHATVDRVTVYNDGRLMFRFRNGGEVEVKI